MTYYPKKHQRRSIRLKGYDYSQEGLYFITMVCQDRAHLFGKITNGKMILNEAGKIAHQCWLEIPAHFPNVVLHEFVIMPNHVHGVIEIVTTDGTDGTGTDGTAVRAKNISPLLPLPRSPSRTVGSIVRGFKIGVTKWMRQNTTIQNVWLRNYYEHIIRNDNSYNRISTYIINNPSKWEEDMFLKKTN